MENNVIYITGNTYEYREELSKVAFFDRALSCYVAPISKGGIVMEITKKFSLKATEAYQEDFLEPRNEKEWEIRKTESLINSKNFQINKLEIEIAGNTDIESEIIKAKQISINELRDSVLGLEEKKRRLEEEQKRGTIQGFSFLSLAEIHAGTGKDWFSAMPPEQPTLLKRQDGKVFLPKKITALLGAMGGAGKTRLVCQLGFSIAAGIPFIGQFQNTEDGTGRVFLGLGEEPTDGMQRRLYYIAQHYGHDSETKEIDFKRVRNNLVTYSFYGQNATLIDEHGEPTDVYYRFLESLKKAEKNGYDLIVLDPLSRFLGANSETDNDKATKFIALMERITQEVKGNPTVLMAHHLKKQGQWRTQEAIRGASAIPYGARWQLNMVLEADAVETKTLKPGQIKNLQKFVRADLVKRNDVPPIESDIILKFHGSGGVLVPSTEEDIKATPISTESDWGGRYG